MPSLRINKNAGLGIGDLLKKVCKQNTYVILGEENFRHVSETMFTPGVPVIELKKPANQVLRRRTSVADIEGVRSTSVLSLS